MSNDHPFWSYLRGNSAQTDSFLDLIRRAVVEENSLDRIGEKTSVEYQKGKVAALRHLESIANKIAQGREPKKE